MEIQELIEQAKNRANLKTDYALAKAMGIDRRIVSDWKKGKKHPNKSEAVQLATLAGTWANESASSFAQIAQS